MVTARDGATRIEARTIEKREIGCISAAGMRKKKNRKFSFNPGVDVLYSPPIKVTDDCRLAE